MQGFPSSAIFNMPSNHATSNNGSYHSPIHQATKKRGHSDLSIPMSLADKKELNLLSQCDDFMFQSFSEISPSSQHQKQFAFEVNGQPAKRNTVAMIAELDDLFSCILDDDDDLSSQSSVEADGIGHTVTNISPASVNIPINPAETMDSLIITPLSPMYMNNSEDQFLIPIHTNCSTESNEPSSTFSDYLPSTMTDQFSDEDILRFPLAMASAISSGNVARVKRVVDTLCVPMCMHKLTYGGTAAKINIGMQSVLDHISTLLQAHPDATVVNHTKPKMYIDTRTDRKVIIYHSYFKGTCTFKALMQKYLGYGSTPLTANMDKSTLTNEQISYWLEKERKLSQSSGLIAVKNDIKVHLFLNDKTNRVEEYCQDIFVISFDNFGADV